MPLFLNLRGRNHPCRFALTELRFSVYANPDYILLYLRWDKGTMTFYDCTTPETYGNVQVFEDEEDAKSADWSRQGRHRGESLHILHIQHRIYDFLVNFCTAIMHYIPLSKLITMYTSAQAHQPAPVEEDASTRVTPLIPTTLPYRTRSTLDFSRLHCTATALYSESQDVI